MNPQSSFKAYREALRQASGSTIPYVGTYLTDLVFICEGNPATVRGLINVDRLRMVHKVIQEVLMFQQLEYALVPIEPVCTLLTHPPHISEDALYALSLAREPRGADPSTIE